MFNNQVLAGSSGQGGVTQQSLKLNDDESQYLSWTPDSAGNRKTWTWSGWVKRGNLVVNSSLFSAAGNYYDLRFTTSDTLLFYGNGTDLNFQTTTVYRDPSAWYHVVVALDTTQSTALDRVKIYVNGEQQTSFSSSVLALNAELAYNNTVAHAIGRRESTSNFYADQYLSNIHFIDGQALDATSFGETVDGYWKSKDYAGTYGTNGFRLTFEDDVVSEGFNTVTYTGKGGTQSISGLGFEPDFVWIKRRDASGSDHYLLDSVRGDYKQLTSNSTAAESTNSTNGTSLDADGFSVGGLGDTNSNTASYVAWAWDAGENNAPTGHSSVTYTGNGGTQSIKGLGFEPDLVWIKERSSTSGHVLTDTVRGVNKHLVSSSTGAETTVSNGLTSFDSDGFSVGSNGAYNQSSQTYVAWCWDAGTGSPVSNTDGTITSSVKANPDYGFSIVSYTGNGVTGATVGHSLGVKPDMFIVKNRTSSGVNDWSVYHSSLTATHRAYLYKTDAAGSTSAWNNTEPTSSVFTIKNFSELNSSGDEYIAYCFAEVAGYSSIGSYTGTGSSGNAVTGLGFRPGWLMVKLSAGGTGSWILWDGTRDPNNSDVDNPLFPNLSNAEFTSGGTYDIQFDSDGFTINNTSPNHNGSGNTYIYMAFKGSYSDYVSDVNTDGTINSRVKANPDYGFSVASYVGTGSAATIGHGLSSAPKMIIVKSRDDTFNWGVYHYGLTSADYALQLNTTIAESNTWDYWNDTAPTSSVFSVGTELGSNKSGSDFIAYCFAEVAGYSSIGSYSGNGSTSGPTVTTGFKPAFVMYKKTNGTGSWIMQDNTRSPVNPVDKFLYANESDAEYSGSRDVDFLSNGFQIKSDAVNINQSGRDYIYMAFADTREAAFWKDVSGQGNHWTPNNLDYRDSLPDSPANNFAVLNPLFRGSSISRTISEGNLKYQATSDDFMAGTFGVSSGKYYFEIFVNDIERSNNYFGIALETNISTTQAVYYRSGSAQLVDALGGSATQTVANAVNGDIISIAVDLDGGSVQFKLNNSNLGTAISLQSGTYVAFTGNGNTTAGSKIWTFNFGQDSTFAGAKPMGAYTDDSELGTFQYQPPAAFKSLCTSNLPSPTIVDGSDYFNAVTYTGTGTTNAITVGFAPDWTWIKQRNTTRDHQLLDIVRGYTNNILYTNLTNAEDVSVTARIDSRDVDGFTVNTPTQVNQSGGTYVSWNWKAGGTAVSNTDGSITSQVSANTDAGFSIVTHTGTGSTATVGHGLGVKPDLIIHKNRDTAHNWKVYHSALGATKALELDQTAAAATTSAPFNNTEPTSTVMTVNNNQNNQSGDSIVSYVFANTDGYCKAGSYTGNGSTDGPFLYMGFEPSFFLAKRSDGVENWFMIDNKRHPFNDGSIPRLRPNQSGAEAEDSSIAGDFLSNGFKIRATQNMINTSGAEYIYLAFAENPFKYATAR